MALAYPQPSDELVFFVNGRKVTERQADPEELLLYYLRKKHILSLNFAFEFFRLSGTKYGCGVGGCGACTVMISTYDPVAKQIQHHPANSCLLPICSLHGAAVTTVEGVGSIKARIHPIQERLAKCHGSQCGFCTPGMVMSIYALLRNHVRPSMEQIISALDGNLCRCTGYRPIIDSCMSFVGEPTCCQLRGTGQCCLDKEECVCTSSTEGQVSYIGFIYCLCNPEEFPSMDPTQEFIFPPELMRMAQEQQKTTLVFRGKRTTWISPPSLKELLELKAKYPNAPLVVGNTRLKKNHHDTYHPIILHPVRIPEMHVVSSTNNRLVIGAACCLAQLRNILMEAVAKLPQEKTKIYQALLQHLRTLAGEQIRSMASLGGHIVSRGSTWDLNPILSVGKSVLNLASEDGERQILLNDQFLAGCENADLKAKEVVVSVLIPYSLKDDFISAFRQAGSQKNAFSIVNSGMRVLFNPGTDTIVDLSILYGGIGSTTISARKSCKKLIGRQWNDQMLNEACRLVREEIFLPPSAQGGKVEYRRTLLVSFLFRFYLEVLHGLYQMYPFRYAELSQKRMSALGLLQSGVPQGVQIYQMRCDVDPGQSPQDPVGRPIMHQSGIKHATGEAVYIDDIRPVDGELSLAVVTSIKAHAKIISIDALEALQVPGVVDVVTARDIPGENGKDEQAYAEDKVICVGQIICAVVAESLTQAKCGAEKVKIVYEDLEPVLTIEDAIKHNSYITEEKKIEKGDIEKGFKSADEIIEGELHIGGQEHFYLETNSVLVIPRVEDKEMDVYVSTQHVTDVQELVASALNLQSNKIMCHVKRVGGAFGGKITKPSLFAVVAAVAANKTGCPVRFALERNMDMLITGGRHPFFGKYKVGLMNDGRIIAADFQCYINGGCTKDESELVIEYIVLKVDNAYNIPNLRVRGHACKTNLPSNTAFSGFGFPQAGLFMEMCIVAVATQTGLPHEKVREINMYKGVNLTSFKEEFNAENLWKCWEECLDKSDYYNRKAMVEEFNTKNYWKKKGIAIIPMKFSVGFNATYFHQAGALIHIYIDGSVLVTHGGIELGQGIHTKMLQIVSRELKIPLSYIHFCETSTTTVPNGKYTAASVGTEINARAVQDACQILWKRLDPIRRDNPNGRWEDWISEAHKQSISLSATGYFKGYVTDMNWDTQKGHAFPYFLFGVACSEVEIDCLTGAHKNIRTDIIMDACFSINPAIDIGQIEGAFIQGVGLYTLEEIYFSPEGEQLTLGPDTYKIPAICDIPEQFRVYLLPNSRNSIAIYSSKGMGEAGFFLGSSVFFAIRDAVAAARKERGLPLDFTLSSPLTAEQIRMACADVFTEMIPKDKPGTYKPWAINVS
ncbi:aldehyde oxidase-like [Melopsittacus undulatus]|uniref:aldehyde oxidase n=1 Tax=Melopsittacus undulatus TaxID=13146 RepID=M1ZMM5_MELUD|nr:aldehyde oxidase-like [Melopsittacus undulatus]DAA64409.1 TPA_inf: aldehyde oxidase 2 [Melopsittacus undulatus]